MKATKPYYKKKNKHFFRNENGEKMIIERTDVGCYSVSTNVKSNITVSVNFDQTKK